MAQLRDRSAASRVCERLSVCLSIGTERNPMTPRPDIADSLAAAALLMHHYSSLEDTLQRIAEVARDSVPGFDEVGISSLRKDGKVETRAATGDLVYALDTLQYSLDEGPCVDTL